MNSLRAACLALCLLIPLCALAAPGILDPSFGQGGKVTTPVRVNNDVSFSVALQPDGKIVLGGYAVIDDAFQFAVVRYRANGTLDPSFNGTGKVTGSVGMNGAIEGIAVQPDGKIVAGGTASPGVGQDFAVARYLPNGDFDPAFGNGGSVLTPIGALDDVGTGLALTPDGKIVVAGFTNTGLDRDFAVVRYLSNGTLDPSFNGTGIVTIPVGTMDDFCRNVAVQDDGKIVLVGLSYDGATTYDLAVVRLNENGSLDTSFNGTGKALTFVGTGNSAGNDVAVQGDGKIVVAAEAFNGTNNDFAVVRYNANGTLDSTGFPGNGAVLTDFGIGNDIAYDLAVQQNGRIVVVGEAFNGVNSDFAIARYLPNGALDVSFGSGGKTITAFGTGNDAANSIAVQGNGRIVVGGVALGASNNDFALARYEGESGVGKILAGPVLNPANGNVYYLLSRDTWPASEARAQALGGHLVTINDGFENQFVLETFGPIALAQPPNGDKSLWLGYNDAEFEGFFQWSSGETPGFTNWAFGQPQGALDNEDFAGMALNFFTPGQWHDIFGDNLAGDLTFGVVEVVPVIPVGNTGTLVPGEGGKTFFEFGAPAIDGGAVGCVATMRPPGGGPPETMIYGDTNGFVLARVGETADTGETFVALGDPVFGNGALGFSAVIQSASTIPAPLRLAHRMGFADWTRGIAHSPGARLAGLFSRLARGGPLKRVARRGGAAPEAGGAQFDRLPSFGLPRNRPGLVFTGKLKRGPGVSAKNDFGVWRETAAGGDSELLLRNGTSVNIAGGDPEEIDKLEVMIPVAMGSDQRRSFAPDGGVMAAATFADGSSGVVRVAPDGTTDVPVRSTDAVPGIPGAQWEKFSAPASRSGGGYAALARILRGIGGVTGANNQVIFASLDGTPRGLARRGDPIPNNANQRFSRFGQPALGQSGLAAFIAALTGRGVTPANRTAIFESRNGVRRTVARLGEPAAEAGPGVTYRRFKSMVVTDTTAGQVVFIGTMKGPGVTPKNNLGLWSTTSTGDVKLLLRSGQVTLVDGDTPTVRLFTSLMSPPATRGQGRSTDADGFITARVRLSDGRTGILRLPLP